MITRKHIGWAKLEDGTICCSTAIRSSADRYAARMCIDFVAFITRANGKSEQLIPTLANKVFGKVSVRVVID
jgi:hypothetical protein